jgi:hypothetical protein
MSLESLAAKDPAFRRIFEGLQKTAAEFDEGRNGIRNGVLEALEIGKEANLDPRDVQEQLRRQLTEQYPDDGTKLRMATTVLNRMFDELRNSHPHLFVVSCTYRYRDADRSQPPVVNP